MPAARAAPDAPRPPPTKSDFPWWLAAAIVLAVVAALFIAASDLYAQVFATVAKGIGITVFVTVVAFALASAIGLGIALMGLSGSRWLRQIARFYVEIIRGVPILVLLFWIAFAGAPAFVAAWNALTAPLQSAGFIGELLVRDVSLLWRAIMALTIGYSAFISEVFRAGIQSVEKGQIEAAKALGLSRTQRFRLIVFPQAIRTILPPLGNDFVAMVKDSSLVSVLGVADITQMGKIYAAGSFRFFETYSIVAYIYLILTVSLSLALQGAGAAAAPRARGIEVRRRRATIARRSFGRITMIVDKANAALDSVYSADTPEGLAKAYAEWAATYDSETASLGYLLPFLITAWVARHVPSGEGPLLDAGCGTGLSGPSLKALGYRRHCRARPLRRHAEDRRQPQCLWRVEAGDARRSAALAGRPFPRFLLHRRVHHQPCAGVGPARTCAHHQKGRPRHLHRARPGVRKRRLPGGVRRAGTGEEMAAGRGKPVVPLLCHRRAGCAGEDVCVRGA